MLIVAIIVVVDNCCLLLKRFLRRGHCLSLYQPLKDVYLMHRYNEKERRQMYDINLSLNHVFKTDFFLRSLNFVLPRKKQNS